MYTDSLHNTVRIVNKSRSKSSIPKVNGIILGTMHVVGLFHHANIFIIHILINRTFI